MKIESRALENMGMKTITSSGNIQLKNIAKLMKSPTARKEQKAFVIEGKKMFEEARSLGLLIKSYVSESFFEEIRKEKAEYFGTLDYEVVADSLFKTISDTQTPQGILAVVKRREYEPEELFNGFVGSLLFLEDIRDPGNLGTILRTAEAAGAAGIILSKESVDVYNPKVVRSTMGSVFRMPVAYAGDFGKTLLSAKSCNVVLYAMDLSGEKDYDQEEYSGKCGIIIGNEARGITDATAALADRRIKIPMCGNVESLNAAVAASVILYELFRRKRC